MNDRYLAVRGSEELAGSLLIMDARLAEFYEYLKMNILCSPSRLDHMRERVREVYFEKLQADTAPDVSDIISYIDDENLSVIELAGSESGYSESEIDAVASFYCHEISCSLDDAISQILWEIGFITERVRALPQIYIDYGMNSMDYANEWRGGNAICMCQWTT